MVTYFWGASTRGMWRCAWATSSLVNSCPPSSDAKRSSIFDRGLASLLAATLLTVRQKSPQMWTLLSIFTTGTTGAGHSELSTGTITPSSSNPCSSCSVFSRKALGTGCTLRKMAGHWLKRWAVLHVARLFQVHPGTGLGTYQPLTPWCGWLLIDCCVPWCGACLARAPWSVEANLFLAGMVPHPSPPPINNCAAVGCSLHSLRFLQENRWSLLYRYGAW